MPRLSPLTIIAGLVLGVLAWCEPASSQPRAGDRASGETRPWSDRSGRRVAPARAARDQVQEVPSRRASIRSGRVWGRCRLQGFCRDTRPLGDFGPRKIVCERRRVCPAPPLR